MLLIGLVAGSSIGTMLFPRYVTKTLYSTITSTITLTKTQQHVSTITRTITSIITKTQTLTATIVKELYSTITKSVTSITTSLITLTNTVTLTSTSIETVTLTKTTTVIKTVTTTVTTTAIIPTRELSAEWIPPPVCKEVDRELFDEKVVLCSISQWIVLQDIAKQLRVPGNPWETAVNVGRWVAKHIEYERDENLFGVKNYIQLPLETLNNGRGDCEDLSLLTATLLLATGEFEKVVLADIEYKDKVIGHVEAGIVVNGKVYMVPWVEDPYPMELETDYYGNEREHNSTISNITLYYISITGDEISVEEKFIDASNFSYTYPPPITSKHLEAIRGSITKLLQEKGYNTRNCPLYLNEIAEYIASYMPQEYPPIHTSVNYYLIWRPIDWYSSKAPEWTAWRINQSIISFWDHIQGWLNEYYTGCVSVYVENDTDVVEDYVYNVFGDMITVEKERPVIVIYFLTPIDYPVPQAMASIDDKLAIWVNVTEDEYIQVLFYKDAPSPIFGIAKPGWRYTNIPYVEADKWEVTSNGTIIEVSMNKIKSQLGQGLYELLIWFNDKIVYVKIIEVK